MVTRIDAFKPVSAQNLKGSGEAEYYIYVCFALSKNVNKNIYIRSSVLRGNAKPTTAARTLALVSARAYPRDYST